MKCPTSGMFVAALLLATATASAQEAIRGDAGDAPARGPVALPIEHNQPARLAIGVHLINAANISEGALRQAESQVTRIYHAIGADIEWVRGAANDAQLTVVIAPHSAEQYARAPGTLGLTTSTTSERGRHGYVFADRVAVTARGSGLSISDLLGPVIAHEMGHMLLPHGHSDQGLMRAAWNANDFRLAARGWLRFTTEQGELIQARLACGQNACGPQEHITRSFAPGTR